MPVAPGTSSLRLTETLLEFHRTQQSGIVRFERGTSKKQLVIARGSLAFAEGNVAEEHLARILIKMGLLPRKELQHVADMMKGGKSSHEAVVLGAGLDGEKLLQGVREQAFVILASLFSWPEASMRLFNAEGSLRRSCSAAIPIPLALVESARRAVRDRNIPAQFLQLKGGLRADPAIGARASFPLNAVEAYAFSQVQGSIPVSQLLSSFPRGETRPEELLQRLLILGLLRLETPRDHSGPGAGATGANLAEHLDDLLQRFEVANLYEILSIPADSREENVKEAYHEMAKLYHPDRFESKDCSEEIRTRAERVFTYITGAYATLGDPAARARYDETRLLKESQVEATLQARASVDLEKEKMAETLFRAGRNALMKRDFERAVKQLKECVWLIPEVSRYHHYLGVAQAEIAAHHKEAEQHLLKAIALDSLSAESYLELGKLYLRVNLSSRAAAQFQQALRWDPENQEAARLLEEMRGGRQ